MGPTATAICPSAVQMNWVSKSPHASPAQGKTYRLNNDAAADPSISSTSATTAPIRPPVWESRGFPARNRRGPGSVTLGDSIVPRTLSVPIRRISLRRPAIIASASAGDPRTAAGPEPALATGRADLTPSTPTQNRVAAHDLMVAWPERHDRQRRDAASGEREADRDPPGHRRLVQRHGYPPTVREIGAAVGLRSPSSVTHHLEALERHGLIRRGRSPRALRAPAPPAPAHVSTDGEVRIPLVGTVAAGHPILAEQFIEDELLLPVSLVPRSRSVTTSPADGYAVSAGSAAAQRSRRGPAGAGSRR